MIEGATRMTSWVAIAYGALDLRGWHENQSEVELMLLSTLPSEPMGLAGSPASLWRRLLEGPVSDAELAADERDLVREFAATGIASDDPNHSARIRRLSEPWLSSPLHEMVYALIASVARDHAIETVFIKGPVLCMQGLRSREHSGDVDVWVEPTRVTDLIRLMEPWGWRDSHDLWERYGLGHSVTIRPDEWGCEVDIHRRMTGCAMDDGQAFDELKHHVDPQEFAGVAAMVPNMAAHSVVAGLHALRPEAGLDPVPGSSRAVVRMLRRGGVPALQFAQDIRAVAALRAEIAAVFPGREQVDYEPPLNWEWNGAQSRAEVYLEAAKLLRWWQRPAFLLWSLWPSPEFTEASERFSGVRSRNAVSARLRRLARALKALHSR